MQQHSPVETPLCMTQFTRFIPENRFADWQKREDRKQEAHIASDYYLSGG